MFTLFKRKEPKDPRLDFTTKRLGLTHAPQVTTTHPETTGVNDTSEAILSLRKEITDKFYTYG